MKVSLLVDTYRAACLSTGPPRPSIAKWTPLSKCLDWYGLRLAGSVLPELVREASAKDSARDNGKMETDTDKHVATEGFLLDCDWQAVQSKGKAVTIASTGDVFWNILRCILWVGIEPLRLLHRLFMHMSLADRYSFKSDDGASPLLSLLNDKFSLLTKCLQYYSTALRDPGKNSRFILIYAHRKRRSFAEWHAKFPGDVDILRCTIMTIIASLERRQYQYLQQRFKVLMMGDARLSRNEREGIGRTIAGKTPCCCEPGLERGARAFGVRLAAKMLKLPVSQLTKQMVVDTMMRVGKIFQIASWFFRCSIARAENLHKLHQTLLVPGYTTMDNLAALSACSRFKRKFDQTKSTNDAPLPLPAGSPIPEGASSVAHPLFGGTLRAFSSFEVFKKRRNLEYALEGLKVNPVSDEYKEDMRAKWLLVGISEEVICDELSKASAVIAAANRYRMKIACSELELGGPIAPGRTPTAASLHAAALVDNTAHQSERSLLALADVPDADVGGCPAPVPVTAVLHNRDVNAVCGSMVTEVAALDKDKMMFNGDLPYTATLYKDFRNGVGMFSHCPKRTKTELSQAWTTRVNERPVGSTYPTGKIPYAVSCGPCCKVKTHHSRTRVYDLIMETLALITKSHCPLPKQEPKLIGKKHVLLAVCDIAHPERGALFVRISEAKDRYGRWRASQMYPIRFAIPHQPINGKRPLDRSVDRSNMICSEMICFWSDMICFCSVQFGIICFCFEMICFCSGIVCFCSEMVCFCSEMICFC